MNREQRRRTQHATPRQEQVAPPNTPVRTLVGLNTDDQKVLLEYDRPVRGLKYTPSEAVLTAMHLLEAAKRLEPHSVDGFTWPEPAAANG